MHRSTFYEYTTKIATDLVQVVDFTDLMQVCHRVASSLLTSSSCIKSVESLVCFLFSSCVTSQECIALDLITILGLGSKNRDRNTKEYCVKISLWIDTYLHSF